MNVQDAFRLIGGIVEPENRLGIVTLSHKIGSQFVADLCARRGEHILHGQLEKFVLVILHAVNPGEDAGSFFSGVICRVIVENELEDRFCIGKILFVASL